MAVFDDIFDLISHALGFHLPHASVQETLVALLLSFALQTLIAAVYKRTYRGSLYSQDYVHTLVILGTVVTVVVQAVRGDKATAFGMFALISVIQFRRSVRQSRDIGFIFLAMGVGLGVAARQYVLAIATTVVVCAAIYIVSRFNTFATARISHSLRIRLTNDVNYDTVFQKCFHEFLSHWDMISVKPIQGGSMTELRLNVSLRDESKPGSFVNAIQQLNGNNRVVLASVAPSYDMGE